MISKSWPVVAIHSVCKFVGGGTPSKKEPSFWNGDIPWASIKDIKGKYLEDTKDSITETGFKNSATNFVEPGEIVLATRINPGRPILAKIRATINQDLKVVKPKIPIDIKFLYYTFKNLEPKVLKVSSGTTVLGVSLNNLNELAVAIPPLPEQRAIVSKIEQLFSELDHGIANLKAAKAKLEIYRQAVLKKAFEGELTKEWREKKQVKTFWKEVQLKDIGDWKGGGTPSKSKPEYWENGTVLWVSPKDMKVEIINSTIDRITEESIDNSSAKWIEKGAILIVVRSGIIRRMLPVAIAGQNLTVNQDLQTIKPNSKFISEFVYWFIVANDRDIRESCAKDGTTVDNINVPILKKYNIPVPEIEEQSQIVQEIESRLSVCDNILANIEEGLEKSEALRQSILKKAFEGRLLSEAEVEACRKEPDWEPAEKLLSRIEQSRNEGVKQSRNEFST